MSEVRPHTYSQPNFANNIATTKTSMYIAINLLCFTESSSPMHSYTPPTYPYQASDRANETTCYDLRVRRSDYCKALEYNKVGAKSWVEVSLAAPPPPPSLVTGTGTTTLQEIFVQNSEVAVALAPINQFAHAQCKEPCMPEANWNNLEVVPITRLSHKVLKQAEQGEVG